MKKYYLLSTLVVFIVIFNLGYVFHDLILGQWFHSKLIGISRDHYLIPVIAIVFLFYAAIQTYLYPIFFAYSSTEYKWNEIKTGLIFGGLIGWLWDSLQGGLIEYATFKMPFEVFLVDSSYHTVEGMLAGIIISIIYKKVFRKK